jgi:hypothetical protein
VWFGWFPKCRQCYLIAGTLSRSTERGAGSWSVFLRGAGVDGRRTAKLGSHSAASCDVKQLRNLDDDTSSMAGIVAMRRFDLSFCQIC